MKDEHVEAAEKLDVWYTGKPDAWMWHWNEDFGRFMSTTTGGPFRTQHDAAVAFLKWYMQR